MRFTCTQIRKRTNNCQPLTPTKKSEFILAAVSSCRPGVLDLFAAVMLLIPIQIVTYFLFINFPSFQ